MDAVQSVFVRQGRPEEAAELAAFGERLFRDAFAEQNRAADLELYVGTAYGERQQVAELRDPRITTLIAEVDGGLAGFAQLRPGKTPPVVTGPGPIELWRFYVDRPFQGRGVARRLMNAAFDAARARGANTMWLGVWERNPRAQAFYRKCGFMDVGEQAFQLGRDSQTDRVMARPLEGYEPMRHAPEVDEDVRRFHRYRDLTRILFLVGCGLILLPAVGVRLQPGVMSPTMRDGLAVLGLVMLLAVFPLYRNGVNRCPRCRRSFSEAPEYASDETSGVPLFQSIAKCPFCGVAL